MLCDLAASLLTLGAHASPLYGIDHTHWVISHFSMDGHSAIDIIGHYQGGGGAWGYAPSAQWRPGPKTCTAH